ncbi:helix-turn-helix domain-containing protein [Vibrio coralliilyticus]|uniref:hypothetical protein n=1 Tax=Vibrio coralliilyticus TaxID=190893 RepID=UPI00068E44B0|nr:hypothetical protein [Vibrio coralliilyticus]NOH40946.1 helix-turn-helix domain-containing protein [Vibrio coralliilyticus]
MRFSLYINQVKALEWGLNVQQSILFSYLYELPSWAKCEVIEGKPYWWSGKDKIISELPILTDKPDTVKRHLASLEKLGLIERITYQNHPMVRITEKGKKWNEKELDEGNGSPEVGKIIPTRSGEKSPPGREKSPAYKYTNDQSTKIQKNTVPCDSEILFEQLWKAYPTKKGKKQALSKFKSILKGLTESPEEFANSLVADINERIRRRQFGFDKLHLTTYLNQERWNDDHEATQRSSTHTSTSPNRIEQHNQELLQRYGHTATPIAGHSDSTANSRVDPGKVHGSVRQQVAVPEPTIDLDSRDFHYVDK